MALRRTKKLVSDEYLEQNDRLFVPFDTEESLEIEDELYKLAAIFPETIKQVKVQGSQQLLVTFDNVEKRLFDLSFDLKTPSFAFLNDSDQIHRFELLDDSRAIGWKNPEGTFAVLAAEVLYLQGQPVE
jgi:hypothetical protein